MDDEQFRYRARRLRDLAEPIGANVYFAPEAHAAYEAAGLIPPRQEPGQRRAPLAPSSPIVRPAVRRVAIAIV